MHHSVPLRYGVGDIPMGQEVEKVDGLFGIIGGGPCAFQPTQCRSAHVAAGAVLEDQHGLISRFRIDGVELGQ